MIIIFTSLNLNEVVILRHEVKLVGWSFLVEVLVEPLLTVIKWLSMDNVYKPLHKLHLLEQKVEVCKYQLRVPESMQRNPG